MTDRERLLEELRRQELELADAIEAEWHAHPTPPPRDWRPIRQDELLRLLAEFAPLVDEQRLSG